MLLNTIKVWADWADYHVRRQSSSEELMSIKSNVACLQCASYYNYVSRKANTCTLSLGYSVYCGFIMLSKQKRRQGRLRSMYNSYSTIWVMFYWPQHRAGRADPPDAADPAQSSNKKERLPCCDINNPHASACVSMEKVSCKWQVVKTMIAQGLR